MIILDDLDKMPFGKYKGISMQDVPASYLHYLWHNGLKNEVVTNPVAAYIKKSLNALRIEDPQLLWK